jgi:hypothetical protein
MDNLVSLGNLEVHLLEYPHTINYSLNTVAYI